MSTNSMETKISAFDLKVQTLSNHATPSASPTETNNSSSNPVQVKHQDLIKFQQLLLHI